METNIRKLESDLRYEGRKFTVQLLVGAAICVGAGVTLANYVENHRPPTPPQVIVVQVPATPASRP
jgi:hypothetical protein